MINPNLQQQASPDDAKFQALLQAHNYTTPTVQTGGWYDKLHATPTKSTGDNPIVETAKTYGSDINAAKDKIVSSITGGAADINNGHPIKGVAESALGSSAGAVQAVFAPIAAPIQVLLDHVDRANKSSAENGNPDIIASSLNSPEANNARQQIANWAKQHPDLAKNLGDAFTVGTGVLGSESGALSKPVNEMAQSAKETVASGIENAKSAFEKTMPKPPAEDISSSIIKEGEQITPEKARASAWQDIQPKATPTTKLAYAKGGNVSDQSMFKGGKLTPTEADNQLLDTHSKLYEDGTLHENMSPTEKQRAVDQKAAQLNADQKGFLAANDKAVNLTTPPKPSSGEAPSKGLFNVLQDIRNKSIVPFSKDVTAKGAYDSTIQMFKNELKTGAGSGATKGATTLTSMDKALTRFGQEMEKFGAWEKTRTGDLTDTAKAREMAIRDIYSGTRDFIAGELGPNNPWKSIRAEETNLYEISDRIAQRIADTVDTSKATQMIENVPLIKAGVGLVKRAIPFGVGAHL